MFSIFRGKEKKNCLLDSSRRITYKQAYYKKSKKETKTIPWKHGLKNSYVSFPESLKENAREKK